MCLMQVGTNPGLAWALHLLAWLWMHDNSLAADVHATRELALRCSWVAGVRDVGGLAFDPSSQEPVVAFTSQQPAPAKGHSAPDDLLYYQDADAALDLEAPLCQW